MTKLTDTQAILLTTASARESGMLLPAQDTITAPADRVRKAIIALVSSGLAVEAEVATAALALRSEGDSHIGAIITRAGRVAIGVTEDANDDATTVTPAAAPPKRETKASAVIALLQRDDGATLADLITATGWLPHTTRAALTGIKKKGHRIEKSKRGDETRYHITASV